MSAVEYLAARNRHNRELARLGRLVSRAGRVDDDAGAEAYCETLIAVHAERVALDRARRAER